MQSWINEDLGWAVKRSGNQVTTTCRLNGEWMEVYSEELDSERQAKKAYKSEIRQIERENR